MLHIEMDVFTSFKDLAKEFHRLNVSVSTESKSPLTYTHWWTTCQQGSFFKLRDRRCLNTLPSTTSGICVTPMQLFS